MSLLGENETKLHSRHIDRIIRKARDKSLSKSHSLVEVTYLPTIIADVLEVTLPNVETAPTIMLDSSRRYI